MKVAMKYILGFSLFVLMTNVASANECQKMMSLFFKDKKTVTIKESPKPIDGKKVVVTPTAPKTPKIPKVETETVSLNQLDKNINMRIEYGEISKSDYQLFVKVNENFKKKTNESLLGEGMNVCFEEFSPEAAQSLVKLINRANGATSINDAFNKLVKGSEEIFGDTKATATAKICALSGGNKCKIFSSAMARNCK